LSFSLHLPKNKVFGEISFPFFLDILEKNSINDHNCLQYESVLKFFTLIFWVL
jgi:hypothetical protein